MTNPAPVGGLVGADQTGTGVPVLPTGIPDFTSIQNTAVPVDNTGAIDVWNLPQWVLDYEKSVAKPFVWDTTTTTTHDTFNRDEEFNQQVPGGSGSAPGTKTNDILNHVDVNMSGEELMKQFASMSQSDPIGFAAIQKDLQAGGWYGSAANVYGGWNKQTETAIADAMVQYLKVSRSAGVPITFKNFLVNSVTANEGINGNTPGGGNGSIGAKPLLLDPAYLKQQAQQAAEVSLGHLLTDSQLNAFVDQFHAQQQKNYLDSAGQNSIYNDQSRAPGEAAAYVQGIDPTGFSQTKVSQYAGVLMNELMSGGPTKAPESAGSLDNTLGMTQ